MVCEKTQVHTVAHEDATCAERRQIRLSDPCISVKGRKSSQHVGAGLGAGLRIKVDR